MSEVITRESYQVKRLEFVRTIVDVANARGLEIGACDLPTIPDYVGSCQFADFRTAEEMIELWKLPPETVVPVQFLLSREKPLSAQIDTRFDYIVACHVIEHVPDPIGYILDLQKLLDPNGAEVIILAVPDKRATLDAVRPSTSLDHLLMDFHDNCRLPTLEHILEFSRAWSPELRALAEKSLYEFYNWGTNNFASGAPDAHCHVWTDEEFFSQMEKLTSGGVMRGLEVFATQEKQLGFNEFMIALRSVTT
jgi:SAM-dependent methyltransferase